MTPRTGRPPVDNPRTIHRAVWLTPDEAALLDAAVERSGQTRADWMRQRLLAAAKRTR